MIKVEGEVRILAAVCLQKVVRFSSRNVRRRKFKFPCRSDRPPDPCRMILNSLPRPALQGGGCCCVAHLKSRGTYTVSPEKNETAITSPRFTSSGEDNGRTAQQRPLAALVLLPRAHAAAMPACCRRQAMDEAGGNGPCYVARRSRSSHVRARARAAVGRVWVGRWPWIG